MKTRLTLLTALASALLLAGGATESVAQGPPGGGPADFLRRMDTNGNGILEPEEMQGPARFMIERLARDNPRIDPSKPIPIDQLTRELERAREQRERDGGGGPPSWAGRSRDGRDSGSSTSDGSSSSRGGTATSAAVEPLVPGFDIEVDLLPVPGFGSTAELFQVKVEESDRREAADRIRRYDKNKDGFLDRDELSSGRWSDDPFVYDRNHDGKLSVDELAVRYARRRIDRANRSSSDSGSRSGDSRSSSGSSSSRGAAPTTSAAPDPNANRMVDFMFDRYDTNKNGVLDRDEWKNFRTDPSEADTNRDGRITREELAVWMANRMNRGGDSRGGDSRGGDSRGGDSRGGDSRGGGWRGGGGDSGSGVSRGGESSGRGGFFGRGGSTEGRSGSTSTAGSSTASSRSRGGDSRSTSQNSKPEDDLKSYRFRSPLDRLPDGLPDWFIRADADGDGQVMMHEFSASWSLETAREFMKFDLNGDGVITAAECIEATKDGIQRGTSLASSSPSSTSSSRSTSGSSSSTRPAAASSGSATPTAAAESGSVAVPVSIPGDDTAGLEQREIDFFKNVIKAADTNGDGVLTRDEWTKMSKNPEAADVNGDGIITVGEYARWRLSQ